MTITRHEYSTHLDGFAVVDCAVRSRDIYYFVARQQGSGAHPVMSEQLAKKRVVSYMRDEPAGDQWSNAQLEGMAQIRASCSVEPISQFVGVDADCAVYVLGSGQNQLEKAIATGPDGPLRGAPRRACTIDGYVYVVSGRRGVCRRVGPETWQSLCPPVTIAPRSASEEYKLTKDWGFSDIGGFSAADIYAVGGMGDAWHFDGAAWRKIALRTNMFLESVCCAGDGVVYIGAQSGTIMAGRDDIWRVVHQGDLSLPFVDLVWHDGVLYGTNDYGLWFLKNDRMEPVELPDEIRVCCGHLSARDGVMVMAGAFGAACLEMGQWTLLFNTFNPPT